MTINNKLIKIVYLIYFFVCFIYIPIQRSYSMEDENIFWQDYQKWFEYKKSQPLTEVQKSVILYFEKANSIFEKADETWGVSPERPNLPNPQEALKIVNKCLDDFSKLKPPSVGKKHYNASLSLIKIIKEYHLKRLSDSNNSDLEQLLTNAIPYEGVQYSEYFNILRQTELFDNIEEEMKNIK